MRVCLVGHSAAGLLSSSAGGSEGQIAVLARELAAREHEVTLVAIGLDEGERMVAGVQVRSGWEPLRGVRYVRAFTYRYPRLYRVLRAERADVYYARGAGLYTPFVVLAARVGRARSVLALASDRDLYASSARVLFSLSDSSLSPFVAPLAHFVYRRWALRAVTWVTVQNQEQATACAALGLHHAVLPNIVQPPPAELAHAAPDRDVIWAGNVFDGRRSKGLEALARLAQMLPETTFTVAGTLEAPSCHDVIGLLQLLPNVAVTGQLPHDEMQQRIAAHRLVINTSPSEGFSNVMLEGWSLGRPCVTLSVNPSGSLTDDRLGICGDGDLVTMGAAITALLAEDRARAAMGARGRKYVRDTHAPDRVCAAFEQWARS